MKKLLFSLSIFSLAFSSFSQDNTLPTTGNVGVGTLNPTAKLDVRGNMKIDSSLVINDSLTVNKTIRVMDKVVIGGKTVMNDNAVAKQNFKVMGNANFDGNATVDGVLRLPNTNSLSNNNIEQGNFDFLLLNENGAARKGSYEDMLKGLKDGIYTEHTPYDPINECKTGGLYPSWYNGIEKIYTQCLDVNVGIRTRDPLFALDVRGDGYFSKTIKVGTPYSPNHSAFFEGLSAPNANKPWMRMTVEENNVKNTVFLVNNDGGLYCTSARVRLKEDIPVPDFVFKSDYALMPLSEVKNFVQTNSHLPNIPSEKEIREDGLSLEEMQLKLLQKIEELTLYVIELDEKNKALEAEVETLKNK